MKIVVSLLSILFYLSVCLTGQSIQSPKQYLGYELGERFTVHHQLIGYFEHLAKNSNQVTLIPYGASYEKRPLIVAAISSSKHIINLEQIRRNNLKSAQFIQEPITGKLLPIIWLSYNIHGDEAASSEAALKTVYHLLTDKKASAFLEEVVVLIDPCLNPDGRERYVNWFNGTRNHVPNSDIRSQEHQPPWPGGRTNHYLFDLNRDWAWQTQLESQLRAKIYHQWMPHVHVDFHEMGIESPYFFAPAARPYHEVITPWQRQFQYHIGDNNAQYFDAEGWLYYSNEIFDLFYPSYGDTWSIFQGAHGFTYEQGGSRHAGVSVVKAAGDTLTLTERIEHHFTTGIASVETTFHHKDGVVNGHSEYFKKAMEGNKFYYKTYVIDRERHPQRAEALVELLQKQRIQIQVATQPETATGFDYLNNKDTSFQINTGDFLVSVKQPQSHLLKVLMEPRSELEDSITYDLTAWALPYAYDVNSFASTKLITGEDWDGALSASITKKPSNVIGFVVEWDNFEAARVLSALLKENVNVRRSKKPFTINEEAFGMGSLLINKNNNKQLGKKFAETIRRITEPFAVNLVETGAGAKPSINFGSGNFKTVPAPKVALLNGSGISQYRFGELWFYFDRELGYPTTIIDANRTGVRLGDYDVIVLVAGKYQTAMVKKILTYTQNGGTVIAMESAMKQFAGLKTGKLESKSLPGVKPDKKKMRYEQEERKKMSGDLAGGIYRVSLDNSHPLAYGQSDFFHIVKRNNKTYELMDESWNVGQFKTGCHVSGFVGHRLKPQIEETLAIGVETLGDGRVIYFTDSPIFRGFWYTGKLMLANAIFME